MERIKNQCAAIADRITAARLERQAQKYQEEQDAQTRAILQEHHVTIHHFTRYIADRIEALRYERAARAYQQQHHANAHDKQQPEQQHQYAAPHP